ncbi:acyl-CoA desaturase [Acinetobacter qingfengensis]|uniref:Acyl-CoA desaturase n=1 Tax=Acinetobacter qingfengensis TaxID=1262585 RepID=A0A1E7QXF9_9GAMM|nr:fatty acid desaturase [Acinetobacter qingfengensis]KAA8731649.1 acyl-CoA desaturase [Acinetobacter qingfengensis]OEY91752.1 acyl-CoA desaturase [Acinetobacter qingfengensis]
MPSSSTSKAPINWPAVLTLLGTPLAAIILIPWYSQSHDFTPGAWISFICLLAFSSLGITAGYHRLWAHKTYEASKPVQIMMMIAGTFAVQNSILFWSSGHRIHHRHVDDLELDPYSAKKGFWYSHIGWMLRDYPSGELDFKNVPDLRNDKLVMFQHKHYIPLVIVTSFGIPALIGWAIGDLWGVMLLGGLLRLIVSHHVTFFINSLCHMFGKRPYTDENTARDNFILAIFTWGEGYHNYHHIFQYDYRNGVKWWQYDPTKWLIWSLSTVGLTRNLRRIPSFNIKRAELAMKFKYAEKDFEIFGHDLNEDIVHLKHKIALEYDMFTQTMNDWAKLKEQELQSKKASMAEKIHQIDLKLKQEFNLIEKNLVEQSDRVEVVLRSLRKEVKRI